MNRIITPKNITEADTELLKEALRGGSSFTGGTERIFLFFSNKHTAKEQVEFLKGEYGIGGGTWNRAGFNFMSHDEQGLSLESYAPVDEHVLFKWETVAKFMPEVIKEEGYVKSLKSEYWGNICIPFDVKAKSGMRLENLPDLRQFLAYANKLFPKVGKVAGENYRNYPAERLTGNYQRIGLNSDNSLKLTLIYCMDNGKFDVNAYLNATERLIQRYPKEHIYIPAEPAGKHGRVFGTELKGYIGIPAEFTERVFEGHQAIAGKYEAWFSVLGPNGQSIDYGTENPHRQLVLENKEETAREEIDEHEL